MTKRKAALGELFQIGSSKRVLQSQWKSEGVPFYRGREITRLATDGFVDNELFISEDLYADFAKKCGVPNTDDIMITAIGTIGNSYVVRGDDRFYFKDASVLWLKKSSAVNSQFINWWLKSPLFFDQLDKGNGATVDTLTIQKLQSVIVGLPPPEEQHRIVHILDEAFDGIATAEANAEKNLQNARALFESHLESVFTQRGEGWVEMPLAEMCQIKPPKAEARRRVSNTDLVSFVPMEDLGIDQKILVATQTRPLAEVAGSYTYFADGDVLLAKITPCFENGKLGIAANLTNGIGFGSSEYIVFRPGPSVDKEWLYYFLSRESFRMKGAERMSGAVGHKRVAKEFIESYPIPAPPLSEQQRIVATLNVIREETQHLESLYQRRLAALEALKKSLLHHAFAGAL